MTVILIDTCVVTDLADPESAWFEWSASMLEQLDPTQTMTINPVVIWENAVERNFSLGKFPPPQPLLLTQSNLCFQEIDICQGVLNRIGLKT